MPEGHRCVDILPEGPANIDCVHPATTSQKRHSFGERHISRGTTGVLARLY